MAGGKSGPNVWVASSARALRMTKVVQHATSATSGVACVRNARGRCRERRSAGSEDRKWLVHVADDSGHPHRVSGGEVMEEPA